MFRITSESITEDDDARIVTINGYNVTVIRRGKHGVEVQVWRDMIGDDAPLDTILIESDRVIDRER